MSKILTNSPAETPDTPAETTLITENTYSCPCETCEVCVATQATTVADIDNGFGKIDVQPMNFVNNLGYMGIGMVGIFVVISVIILATTAMNKLFSGKK